MSRPPALRKSPLSALAAAAAAALLGGCASFSPDGGFGTVESMTHERIDQTPKWVKSDEDAQSVRAAVRTLLATPLTADAAAQAALINNRGLQAAYAELGIAEAELVQAGRLRNPGFSFARLTQGDDVEIERAFLFDVLGLFTMPVRTGLERRRFELTKTRIAAQTLQVATDARRAYYNAVAAQEGLKYMEQARAAAEAGAELARRLAAAGNFSKLDRAREQAFYAEVTAQLARTRQATLAARERLTRVMGLWGDDIRFSLPDRLPDPPKAARDAADLEGQAMRRRLDVQAAQQQAENIAASLGLTKVTGFVNVLELGYLRTNESGMPRKTGYEVELSLPIFDWGGARVARAEYTYMQAVNRAADIAVRARSEVREAYGAYRTAFDLAHHYRDEIVPLRKRISDENALRYSGMLISVFELLADARQQVAAVTASIEALRDYWVADTNLHLALNGQSTGALAAGTEANAIPAGGAPAGH